MAESETYERGREMCRRLLGDAYTDRANRSDHAQVHRRRDADDLRHDLDPAGARSQDADADHRRVRFRDRWTTIVTTVHPLQIVRSEIPMLRHDLPLDYLVTPAAIIECRGRYRRPPGILWDALPAEKVEEIPLLARLARMREAGRGRR